MYLLAKFDDHRSYRNRDINSYTNPYMDTLEKAELTTSLRYIAIFLKSGIPIYNSKVPDTASRKTKRRRTQAIAKRYAFHTNAKNVKCSCRNFHQYLLLTNDILAIIFNYPSIILAIHQLPKSTETVILKPR